MTRSHTALARGARPGVRITSMPSAPNTASKLVSRSRTRNRNPRNRSDSSRARWVTQPPVVSIIQRKVVTPNDFTDLDQITDRLAAFEDRYNTVAKPFDWRFTRDDLARLLERIAGHDPAAPVLPSAA
jgi:hypothetical protein